jgi:hypothetical protein
MTPDKGFLSRSHVPGNDSPSRNANELAWPPDTAVSIDGCAGYGRGSGRGSKGLSVGIMGPQAEFDSHSQWSTESSLEESLRFGECLVCSNLIESERREIEFFLWDGMNSPHVLSEFLESGGFCPRHFWMAERVEEDGWPAGGVGIATLCERLVERAIRKLPRDAELTRRETTGPFRLRRETTVPQSGLECIFCRQRNERERSILDALQYLKNKAAWSRRIAQSPPCMHHALMALRIWRDPADKLELCSGLGMRLQELEADLKEFVRKHDWNHRDEPLGREKDAVLRAMQILTGLQRQFPLRKIGAEGGGSNDTRQR